MPGRGGGDAGINDADMRPPTLKIFNGDENGVESGIENGVESGMEIGMQIEIPPEQRAV